MPSTPNYNWTTPADTDLVRDGAGAIRTLAGEIDTTVAAVAVAAGASALAVQDEKASGVDGGTFTLGAWRTRDLNTVIANDIAGASLASNQITLPAGTYEAFGRAPAYLMNSHQTRLYNVTDGAILLLGSMGRTGVDAHSDSWIMGKFTLAGIRVVELQHYSDTTRSTDGFGFANPMAGDNAVFSQLFIRKVA